MLRSWLFGLYALSMGTKSFKLVYKWDEDKEFINQKWTEITASSDSQDYFNNTDNFTSRMKEEVFTKPTKFDVVEIDLLAHVSNPKVEFNFYDFKSGSSLMFKIFCDPEEDTYCVPVIYIDFISISKGNSSPGFATRLTHFFHKFLNSCSKDSRRRIELDAITSPPKLIGVYIWLRKQEFKCKDPVKDQLFRSKTDLELKKTELACFAVYYPSAHVLD